MLAKFAWNGLKQVTEELVSELPYKKLTYYIIRILKILL